MNVNFGLKSRSVFIVRFNSEGSAIGAVKKWSAYCRGGL